MLKLTQLIGFGVGGASTDASPNPIDFDDISDAGVTAAAATNTVTIAGTDIPITLRLTLTDPMSPERTVSVYRDGSLAGSANSGTTIDVAMTNGQTLQYGFVNAQDNSLWIGTATVTNVTDANAVLDTFAYSLQDTGSGGGVSVSVAGVSVAEWNPP
jgi:hypothetical protein